MRHIVLDKYTPMVYIAHAKLFTKEQKTPMKCNENQLHIETQIKILRKNLKRAKIMDDLNMAPSTLSMALKGTRPHALIKVAQYVANQPYPQTPQNER